ncbi:MAG: RIP metalloprotease RseP [Gammaproteobacteria bacterium]|nr:RIP metalloprotease RseP [Gammaproteobacteria bacterium]NIN62664.1 RIP metalloprotease RseP [Gammaproteobacteria bacterium]NIO63202.1 RIP metalloprotease RseP [Gammaproteobacteria bacterium]NIQ11302.1 RIP metalloprotease RseP [Gammaproteobacteria bacterium]NIQ20302.1 RIP metalloprotease RseP [Gammaproteobacteria bacterium]
MDILQHILAFIIALGVLITFHEFGHFWVARKFDVKILRFSIGFGKPIWKKYIGEDNTELVIAALPLGGYVKMLDERESPVQANEQHRAFNRKPLSQRTAIVAAGPLFNFLFAILAYWLMYMVGLTGLQPLVGEVKQASIAQDAGIQVGDKIIAVDTKQTATWTMVVDNLIGHVVAGNKVRLTLSQDTRGERDVYLDLQEISIDDLAESGLLERLGITPKQFIVPAVIGEVHAGLPADRAGLKPGDQIRQVNGEPIDGWREWVEFIRENPEQILNIKIQRNGNIKNLQLRPESKTTESGNVIGFIGAANEPPDLLFAKEAYAPIAAFTKAIQRTLDMSWLTLQLLGKMLTGEASYKNLSGPISIAQYAGDSAKSGLATFLWFLGIVSISLGVLNLLPIPLLDGGHLLYYLIEFLTRKPVSESVQLLGQQIGLFILLALMILVFYNDIVRITG